MTGIEQGRSSAFFPLPGNSGVDEIINVEVDDPVARILDITDGKGVDLVIEASGSGAAISQAVDMAKTTGKICAIGLGSKDEARFKWNSAMYKALTVYYLISVPAIHPGTKPCA